LHKPNLSKYLNAQIDRLRINRQVTKQFTTGWKLSIQQSSIQVIYYIWAKVCRLFNCFISILSNFLYENTTKKQVKVVILGVLDLSRLARELALRVLFWRRDGKIALL